MNPIYAPAFAAHRPERAVEIHDVDGQFQAVCWDRASDQRRVLTHAPHGVNTCEIEPGGDHVWWFDADVSGEGIWLRQPFDGGPPAPALDGVPPGRQYGIAFDGDGDVAAINVGIGTESHCYLGPPGGAGRLTAIAARYLSLVDMTAEGRLLTLAGRADTDQAITFVRPADGGTSTLAGSRDRRLWPMEFRPGLRAAPELLVVAEEGGRYALGVWTEGAGIVLDRRLPFDSEIDARWYDGGRRVLVQHDRAGRSRLLLVDLDGGDPTVVPTPPGTILDLASAPEGRLYALWSREAVPPRRLVVEPARDADAAEVPTVEPGRRELWTRQPYGRIHSFVATPPGAGPWDTVFLVHGGPLVHDRDNYDHRVELFIRAGYAVVRTNYRGSTGYGPRWRHGFGHRVGLAQLDDLAAVREHLIELGVASRNRVGLCGYSWGGYLVLLAMGAQPEAWAVGLAVSPVADYLATYRATTPALRELDDELFGGTPEEVPDRYRDADPMTYVDDVRGPLFIAAAVDDERCPPEQVDRYVAALRRRSVPHRLIWTDGGHYGGDADEHMAVVAAMIDYAGTVLGSASDRRISMS